MLRKGEKIINYLFKYCINTCWKAKTTLSCRADIWGNVVLLVFSGFYGRKNVFPCLVFSTYLSVARLPASFLPSFELPSAKTSHLQKHLGTWLEGSFKVACNLWCSWKGSPFQFDKTHLTLGCQFHLELIFSSHLHHLVLNFARQRSLTLFPWVSILQCVVVLCKQCIGLVKISALYWEV